jgi:hypothetical protein
MSIKSNVMGFRDRFCFFTLNLKLNGNLKFEIDWRVSAVIKKNVVGFEVFTAVVMKSIIFWDMTPFSPLRWRRYVPPKRRVQLNGLHGVISQKTLFMFSAGRILMSCFGKIRHLHLPNGRVLKGFPTNTA